MQLERDALDEMGQIIRPADDVGIRLGCRAAHCDGPAVGVIVDSFGQALALLQGEGRCGAAIDDGPVYGQSLVVL